MINKELKTLLEKSGLPVAYHHFNEATDPPFLVFLRTKNNNIPADDTVCVDVKNYDVELYTEKKDTETENAIEELFKSYDIFYNVTDEEYVESEKMYEVVYSIQI